MSNQRIVCAANRNANTGLVICGARHFDAIMHRQMEGRPLAERDDWRRSEQGFIDQSGQFLTREQAWPIALAAQQIRQRVGSDEGMLFSENLY